MQPFSELTGGRKLTEVLRWLGVLPLALLADIAALQIVSAMFAAAHLVGNAGGDFFIESIIPDPVRVFLYYVPRQSAFVIAGAKTAPRHQMATAIVLTVVGICFSLMTHVVFQHLGGNRVGFTNYMHLAIESVGLLGGAAFIVWQEWKKGRGTMEGI
jgi:hypothetical protein